MITYNYSVDGFAANDQTWFIEGQITTLEPGQFYDAIQVAMQSTFNRLTKGEAVYGKPGVGCSGPYRVRKFEITEVTHHVQ